MNEKTIVVQNDFGTIQAAVDNADSGDIILVKEDDSPFLGNITIGTDRIKLIGEGKEMPAIEGGNQGTILDGTTGVLVNNLLFKTILRTVFQ
ncbi:hypothetical protein WAK64_13270 [Bacillus spongiae]|uniref:Uncharacterized protein n=1 Tax=Bacillus spongiae TaxID=2683610 RepID=A0ABU8HFA4_9BACI